MSSQAAQADSQECRISRVFDAPPELVYRAFVDPDQLAQWWGPEGHWALRETIESDPRAGGHLRLKETASELPDLRVPIEITFTEVIENELLAGAMVVHRPALPDWPEKDIRSTLRLEFHPEPGGRTRLEIRHGPFAGRELEGHLQGWQEQLGKLNRHLLAETETSEITISRVFDAPPELVYRAFVDPDQLSQWFGPVGMSVPRETVEIDARPGGVQRFVMVIDDDPSLRQPIDAIYTEVIENKVLDGHAEVEGIPGTTGKVKMRLRLEFYPEPAGKTRLELTQGPFTKQIGADTKLGWESSFTRLDSLLAA